MLDAHGCETGEHEARRANDQQKIDIAGFLNSVVPSIALSLGARAPWLLFDAFEAVLLGFLVGAQSRPLREDKGDAS